MRIFEYSARNAEGAVERGEMEAKNRTRVVESLQNKGLIVVKVEEKVAFMNALNEINIGGVPMDDKVVFMRQLATMMSSGLPLTQSLEILAAQATNPLFRRVLKDVLTDVEGGSGLAKAFGKQPGVFDDVVLNLIKAGEDSGKLEEVFLRLAEELEKQRNFDAKVKSAMIYPIIIMVTIVAVVALVMVFMIPAIKDIFTEFQSDIPMVTKILIMISDFTRNFWWIVLIILGSLAGGFKYYIDTPTGRRVFDNFKLTVPIFGKLFTKIELAKMTQTLFLLLSSGLPILESLDLVSDSLSNVWFKEAVAHASQEVEKGSSLALPLSREEKIPLLVSQMIGVGEESGRLDEVMKKMAEYYTNEVDIMTNNLATMIEPIMLIIMGIVVAFIAVAVYMPLFSLAEIVG
ncbi:MAG: type II secretion system F family protein [Candidatus Dojkabacteria bacterium]|nr:type II secretion system F family protein [Candidatus Dojkabacteria bacterium]